MHTGCNVLLRIFIFPLLNMGINFANTQSSKTQKVLEVFSKSESICEERNKDYISS